MRLVSWNVNGLRACATRGLYAWLQAERPDVLALQEIKIGPEQLTEEMVRQEGYRTYWNHADRPGYSGVALYSRQEPVSVEAGLGIEEFDLEGRVLVADYGSFLLYNVYFPNGGPKSSRVAFKLAFYEAFLEHAEARRREGRSLVVCGDFNVAHREIDIERPEENRRSTGFLPEERAWMDRFLARGYLDTLRVFDPSPRIYTWWAPWRNHRQRNVGWRIDYFVASEDLRERLVGARTLPEVMGSDHCPVELEVAVP